MIKEIGIKKEAGVVEYYGITLSDDMVGHGLTKDDKGVVSVNVENLVKTTWAELKALRDEAKLNAGTFYRITDYVTTTTQSETKSANHPFDVIVLALSENTLCEDAKAILHEGDTYFADSDLSAWELKYCLDNDTTRFAWADETNGKGVIFRMVDEKQNDCPYDFKNILIKKTKYTGAYVTGDNYYYTFSYVVNGVLYDGTIEAQVKSCYGNSMKVHKTSGKINVNNNVFRNVSFDEGCHSNTFGYSCYSNTFGYSCFSNTFGDSCYSNTFGNYCGYNTFGNDGRHNTFGYGCHSNTFGDSCYSNTFGDSCHSNTFGYSCFSNTFGYSCGYNTFGNDGRHNTFGNDGRHNTFGDSCGYNTFGDNTSNRKLEGGIEKIIISLSEEYYDDGSGQLVPIKHPDLSTQPSILPYKFMGQYVYEQLIPKSAISLEIISPELFVINPDKIVFLDVVPAINCKGTYNDYALYYDEAGYHLMKNGNPTSSVEKGLLFLRVVYTSMPEDSDYYGYNSY